MYIELQDIEMGGGGDKQHGCRCMPIQGIIKANITLQIYFKNHCT